MQYRDKVLWNFAARAGLRLLTLFTLILQLVACPSLFAQDINNGRALYITPLVTGQFSCSNGQCHGPSPANNQNKIQSAADDPGRIGLAISQVAKMAFLKNNVTGPQLADLAAYIGNPGGATGSPVANLAPSSVSFPATVAGNSSGPQSFSITNSGTTALLVSGVASSNSEFSVVSSCGTINAGASCSVSVSFTPDAAATGTHSGTITVSHNASGGASTVSVSGITALPVIPGIQATPTPLDFGSVTSGSFSGIQPITVASVGTAPLIITSISDSGAAFPFVSGSCAVGIPIAVGTSCTLFFRFVPTVVGAQSSALAIRHNASAVPTVVTLLGVGLSVIPSTRAMVEYLYAPLNYYFVTSRDDDKAVLDKAADFQRTGLSFPVFAAEAAGSKPINRFFFDQIAVNRSRGSHFYTLLDSDKSALVALNPGNAQTPRLPYNEGVDSWAFLPLISGPGGSCVSGQQPVYRLFRGRTLFPDDPNHRYTTNIATYNAFVALGWDGEGVNFCVPQE